jgi:hypothetical protein
MRDKRMTALFFAASFIITLAFAVYQRGTGPTYPLSGETRLDGSPVKYRMIRSQDVGSPAEVAVDAENPEVKGVLAYRRYPTSDSLTPVEMERRGGRLAASMPSQPPAGKLEYQVRLSRGGREVIIPETPAIIRFKGAVPAPVLFPHIILTFLGLLFSVKAALSYFAKLDPMRDSVAAMSLLLCGGLILGPIVQKYAFGAFWTGWPFGSDWTDNKTAAAVLSWIVAIALMRMKGGSKRWAPVLACAATLIAFGIPHSFHGSQLDWSTIPVTP